MLRLIEDKGFSPTSNGGCKPPAVAKTGGTPATRCSPSNSESPMNRAENETYYI